MKKASLIGHVIELYQLVRYGSGPADAAANEFFRARRYLGSRDRRFVSESLFGMIRNDRLLRLYADEVAVSIPSASGAQKAHPLVLYAAYAIKLLGEPVEAVASDIFASARVYLGGYDSALLARAINSVAVVPHSLHGDPVRRVAVAYSFPDFVIADWMERFGEQQTERLCWSLNQPAPLTLRVNTGRLSVEQCQAALLREGVRTARTILSPVGLVMEKRVNIRALDAFRRGYFEMQDEGSQIVTMLVDPTTDASIVDACAGGGGKSLQLSSLMQNTGSILAVDVEQHRLQKMRERIDRAGVTNVRPCLAARDRSVLAEWHAKADRVLIDAPCSGIGTVRRNPLLKVRLTPEDVARYAHTQESVLESYAPLVKPGGRVVYVTCSLLSVENEHAVERFLHVHGKYTLLDAPDVLRQRGISLAQDGPFLTLLPSETATDGFFAAVFERSP